MAAMAKSQTKITELEAAAKQAAEAVEEAKQKAEKLQGEIDKLLTEYDEEVARLVKPSDLVTHLQSNVREVFTGPLWKSRSPAPYLSVGNSFHRPFQFVGGCKTPTPTATDVRDDVDLQQDKEKAISNDAMAVARTSERPRRQKWWSSSSKRGMFSHLERHINSLLRLQLAGRLRQRTKP